MLSEFVVLGLVTGLFTITLCPPVIAFVQARGAISLPEDRSLHSRPTPRGGGVAPAGAAIAVGATAIAVSGFDRSSLALLVAGAGFAAVGLAEDLHGVAPLRRFGLQVVVALGTAALLAPSVAIALAVALWLVAYANAFNFMDGINGVSAAGVLVTCAAWAVAGSQAGSQLLMLGSAVLGGAALGFLPFNAPVARVFLGDVGSYFFGAAVAALAVVALAVGVPWLAVLGPLVILLADTGLTLVRRVIAGEPWHLPHKTHVYQRLVTSGWSHVRTTLVVAGCSAVCAALGLAGGPLAAVVMASVAAAYVLGLPRLVATRHPSPVPARTTQEAA